MSAQPSFLHRQVAYWRARGLRRPVLLRSLRASVVVGSLLTLLNQGDYLLSGDLPPSLWWKIPLTYLVPFVVATYGALGATARPGGGDDGPRGDGANGGAAQG